MVVAACMVSGSKPPRNASRVQICGYIERLINASEDHKFTKCAETGLSLESTSFSCHDP
jgi:hypothetical protein